MSNWATYRDRTKESAVQCVARILVAQPGLLTADYQRLAPGHNKGTVKNALHRLKLCGYVTSRRAAGRPGKGMTTAVDWHPTMALVRMVAQGVLPTIDRDVRAADVLEDDGWTPPTNYIGGVRAVILGLRKVA